MCEETLGIPGISTAEFKTINVVLSQSTVTQPQEREELGTSEKTLKRLSNLISGGICPESIEAQRRQPGELQEARRREGGSGRSPNLPRPGRQRPITAPHKQTTVPIRVLPTPSTPGNAHTSGRLSTVPHKAVTRATPSL